MKVNPYYSANLADASVYHDHSRCTVGMAIEKTNKRFGTNGYPRCRECVKLG